MPTPSSCFVTLFDLTKADRLKEILLEQGFTISKPSYSLFSGKKKGVSCTLYESGKLMVQGKEMQEFIEFILEPQILEKFERGYEKELTDAFPHIGIDESGKGDFFGPLCIAGVYADVEQIHKLIEIGVKDSKKLTDASIQKISIKIRQLCLHHVVRIFPQKYNELYTKFGNLNLLLAWGHSMAASKLVDKSQCLKILIDQFASEHVALAAMRKKNPSIELTQRTKGEEDPVVAAASILARAAFIEGITILEQEVKIKLPKGASSAVITAGKLLVKNYGEHILLQVGKLHFKTAQQILEKSS